MAVEFDKKCLEVIFSSDDAYARHMGVAMYSLLDKNRTFERIRVYLIENGIQPDNKAKLEETAARFPNAEVHWIDFSAWLDKLNLNQAWPLSFSSYARLFVASMLPESVNRILYLDSDMVVNDSLSALWQTDLQGNIVGAVQDFVNDTTKDAVGVERTSPYFNAGMLLIDLYAWRAEKVEDSCLHCIEKHDGNVTHHDQGVLNEVLHGRCTFLPIRYNLMTIHYIFDRRKLKKYYQDHAPFYREEEVEEAKAHPAILHYTPSFTTRPWVAHCKHPRKDLYWETLQKTPWKGCAVSPDRTKWYLRLINWRYRHLWY